MVLVVIVTLAVMNVSVFVSVRDRNLVQNAGDAAAVEMAAEQGRLLNEIGRLNLAHMRGEDVELEQRRLCLLGPVRAYSRIQRIAEEEGGEGFDGPREILSGHLDLVISEYSKGDPYVPSYDGAWGEYADEISAAVNNCGPDGFAAGADNIQFYGLASGYLPANREFYDAILSRDWCWFHFNAEGLLKNYGGYGSWAPPVGATSMPDTENSEIFSLHLTARTCALTDVLGLDEIEELEKEYDFETVSSTNQTWFFFSPGYLREWTELKDGYPVVAPPREEFDHIGCSAVIRCERNGHVWSAAARPLGPVEKHGLVLPSFSAARLIPLEGANGANLYTADLGWVRHLRYHLGPYLEQGKFASDCEWCRALRLWERDSFRKAGVAWLKMNSKSCRRGSGGTVQRGGAHGH